MVRSRWETYQPFWNTMRRQMSEASRMMNELTHRENGNGKQGPALNAWVDEEKIHVTAELPGLTIDDLEVLVTGNTQLTIKGERKKFTPEKATMHRRERGFGKFERTVTLPFAVDAENVEAKLEHGVFSITLAKHESAKPRKITVQGA